MRPGYSLSVLGAVELENVVQDAVLEVGDVLVDAAHKLVPVQSVVSRTHPQRRSDMSYRTTARGMCATAPGDMTNDGVT